MEPISNDEVQKSLFAYDDDIISQNSNDNLKDNKPSDSSSTTYSQTMTYEEFVERRNSQNYDFIFDIIDHNPSRMSGLSDNIDKCVSSERREEFKSPNIFGSLFLIKKLEHILSKNNAQNLQDSIYYIKQIVFPKEVIPPPEPLFIFPIESSSAQDSSEIDLPIKIFGNIKTKYSTCNLCLSDYEQEEEVNELTCNHVFHSTCLSLWLVENKICPYCRGQV